MKGRPVFADIAARRLWGGEGVAQRKVDGLFFDLTNGREAGWSGHRWDTYANPYMAEQWAGEIADLKAASPLVVETPWFRQMYLGEWVIDLDKLVYRFNPDRNTFAELPTFHAGAWHYLLGVDLGYNDPTAFALCAYHDYDKTLYVLEAEKHPRLDVTSVAHRIRGFQARYELDSIVIDGASKQAVEEMRRRHDLPLRASDKTGKSDFSYRGATYSGEHPGILDADAFARVREMLGEGRADRRRTGNKHGFLLRGLVRCVACGSAMTSSTSAPRGKAYRYYCCTSPRRRGTGECPVRAVSAAELERFVVDRIRDIGRDPAVLQETLSAIDEQRGQERPALAREQRTLQVEHKACRDESRRLVSALGAAPSASVAERLAELDLRAGQIEARLSEIQGAIAAIDHAVVDPEDVAAALAQFDPVWDALVPREQTNLLQLLIERVDYDGVAKEVAITFRPDGVRSLGTEQRSAA